MKKSIDLLLLCVCEEGHLLTLVRSLGRRGGSCQACPARSELEGGGKDARGLVGLLPLLLMLLLLLLLLLSEVQG